VATAGGTARASCALCDRATESQHTTTPPELTEKTLLHAVGRLARRDRDLARVVEEFGPPPLWAREPGFPTLVHMILEQQVSLASARAAFERLLAAAGSPLHPEHFLEFDARQLKRIGFSRQKTEYCRLLAERVLAGKTNFDGIAESHDDDARAALVEIKGVGAWTADVYLLMALRRPDAWPAGDLALAKAAQRVKRLRKLPSPEKLETLGEAWRPWRAVAARILWHHYLSTRAAKKSS